MSDAGLGLVQETLDQVRVELRTVKGELHEANRQNAETNAKLDEQNAKLTGFVPKRRFWWAVAAAVIVVVVLTFIGWKFREQDRAEAARRRDQLHAEAVGNRNQRLAGCERGNELRATLRGVIERAYTPGPIPDGLSDELHALIVQSQERALVQRAIQLGADGVQPVDCEKAHPPVADSIEK